MTNSMFPRNFVPQQDNTATLALNMQNYIQSQQASQPQQQRAQQTAQQTPLMRQQFNMSQSPANQQNLLSMNQNIYAQQQQQAHAVANLAAQQRQSGLSTLNQPINPIQTPQTQPTPQVQPRAGQFPQIPDTTVKDASMTFNPQQLHNRLQSPSQFQQLTPQEIQKLAEDIQTYHYYVSTSKIPAPSHLKELRDKAVERVRQLTPLHPGLPDQVRTLMAAHGQKLEMWTKIQQPTNDANQNAANTVQPAATNVQQQLQQAQAQAQAKQQFNRMLPQQTNQDQTTQINQTSVNVPQLQNVHTQQTAQGVTRAANPQGAGAQQLNQQAQQTAPQTSIPNPLHNANLTSSQQLQMIEQMQLQQQRQQYTNQQLLAGLNPQNTNLPPQQLGQLRQLQLQQMQRAAAAAGNNGANVINPNRMIPTETNPHNYPIPYENQQKMIAIGVPSDRMSSWKDVIGWLQEAFKAGIITDEQYSQVRLQYGQVSQQMASNPRYLQQQIQLRNNAQLGNVSNQNQIGNIQTQNQQLVSQMQQQQMQQARQAVGQQASQQQQVQTSAPSIPPQVQMNMTVPQQQVPQQMSSQPQPAQPQMQQSQQQQQHQQQQHAQAAQPRKARAPPKKMPAKKGQDAANAIPITNTPTPSAIPEPSPAQHHATLPNSTPINVMSPAIMHHPGSTPQGSGISPTDTHTPSQGDSFQQTLISQVDFQGLEFKNAQSFCKMEMEKLRLQLTNQMARQQPKQLTTEQKQRMRALLMDNAMTDYIGRIEKLAPILFLLTRDEGKTSNFLRVVCL